MTAQAILNELRLLGRESDKKVMLNHGVPEPFSGVQIEELKKIQKRVKRDDRDDLRFQHSGMPPITAAQIKTAFAKYRSAYRNSAGFALPTTCSGARDRTRTCTPCGKGF